LNRCLINENYEKGSLLTCVHADTSVFAKISEAKMHDKKFLQHLNPSNRSKKSVSQEDSPLPGSLREESYTHEEIFDKLRKRIKEHYGVR
jgi:hypothetical protein